MFEILLHVQYVALYNLWDNLWVYSQAYSSVTIEACTHAIKLKWRELAIKMYRIFKTCVNVPHYCSCLHGRIGVPSGASQRSLDPPFHKLLPAVLKVQPPAPPPPDAHPLLPDAHHPPSDVHHERRPTLAEPISCSPSHNPGKHIMQLSHHCCACNEGAFISRGWEGGG